MTHYGTHTYYQHGQDPELCGEPNPGVVGVCRPSVHISHLGLDDLSLGKARARNRLSAYGFLASFHLFLMMMY